MSAWISMVEELAKDRTPPPTLAEWLMQARSGQWMVVVCESPKDKGNVQSRVNRITLTRGIKAAATRLPDGVLVKRL